MWLIRRRDSVNDQELSSRIEELQGGQGQEINIGELPPGVRAELVILSYLVSIVRDFSPEQPYLTRWQLEARITGAYTDLTAEELAGAFAATAGYWEEIAEPQSQPPRRIRTGD
jgi:hypothetical protein